MKIREGEGGKKANPGKPEIILCREEGRVSLYISVDNGHLQRCGTPGVNWRYRSPKSILLEVETGRGRRAGDIIDMGRCLADMTGYKLRDELTACDIGSNSKP